jgi:hypothetical protein
MMSFSSDLIIVVSHFKYWIDDGRHYIIDVLEGDLQKEIFAQKTLVRTTISNNSNM